MILTLLGCMTMGSMQTGRTLDKNQFKGTGGFESGYLRARPLNLGMTQSNLGFRWGATDDWELGGHVGGWFLGVYHGQLGVDVKRRLVRAPSAKRGWDISLGMGLQLDGVWSGGGTGMGLGAQVALPINKNLPNGSAVVAIPRVAVQHLRSRGSYPVTKPLGGLNVGYAAFPGRWTLFPYLGVLISNNNADKVSQLVTTQGGFSVSYTFGPGASEE